jgi:hypothetical protein
VTVTTHKSGEFDRVGVICDKTFSLSTVGGRTEGEIYEAVTHLVNGYGELVLFRFFRFHALYVICQNLTANDRTEFLTESPGKRLHTGIMRGLFLICVWRSGVVAVKNAENHQRAADRSANLTHPPHATAKGGCQPHSHLFVKPRQIGKCKQNRL